MENPSSGPIQKNSSYALALHQIMLAVCAAVQIGCSSPLSKEGTQPFSATIIRTIQEKIEKTNLTRREIHDLVISEIKTTGRIGACEIQTLPVENEIRLVVKIILYDTPSTHSISGLGTEKIKYLRENAVTEIRFTLAKGIKCEFIKNPDLSEDGLATIINDHLSKGIFEDFSFLCLGWEILRNPSHPDVAVSYQDLTTGEIKTFSAPIYNPNAQVGSEKITEIQRGK